VKILSEKEFLEMVKPSQPEQPKEAQGLLL